MKILNLTPNTIKDTQSGRTFTPSGKVAKLPTTTAKTTDLGGVQVFTENVGNVTDLPNPIPDTLLIVSPTVRLALPNRVDLISPNSPHEDESPNQTLECSGFTRNKHNALTYNSQSEASYIAGKILSVLDHEIPNLYWGQGNWYKAGECDTAACLGGLAVHFDPNWTPYKADPYSTTCEHISGAYWSYFFAASRILNVRSPAVASDIFHATALTYDQAVAFLTLVAQHHTDECPTMLVEFLVQKHNIPELRSNLLDLIETSS